MFEILFFEIKYSAVAVVIFGTNFIPVKKIATGDGLFFQLIVCVHIWLVGLIICFIRQSFVLHPLPMLGGFLWATGNLCKGNFHLDFLDRVFLVFEAYLNAKRSKRVLCM